MYNQYSRIRADYNPKYRLFLICLLLTIIVQDFLDKTSRIIPRKRNFSESVVGFYVIEHVESPRPSKAWLFSCGLLKSRKIHENLCDLQFLIRRTKIKNILI